MANRTDSFLAHCSEYYKGQKREKPINERTLGRYYRGLQLVMKIVGHDLEVVSDRDQLVFIEGIAQYSQGTRRVSAQIFQRYVAWGIKNGYFDCRDLLRHKLNVIIGPKTPPKYRYIEQKAVAEFFKKLKSPHLRILCGLIYYAGLNGQETIDLKKDNVTESGIFVYRPERGESQLIPLPLYFHYELKRFVATLDEDQEHVLSLSKAKYAHYTLTDWYRAATIEAGELIGTSVRDLRTSAIRHFFELCQDTALTKQFAGVKPNQSGWFLELEDDNAYQIRKIAELRRHHGSTKR